MIISPFRGRWFCGNLCLRGSFSDFWIGRISRKVPIHRFFRSMLLRAPVFIGLMGFMISRIFTPQGMVDKIWSVFVTMCIPTTPVSILFGVALSPRTWCTFCPLGTLQRRLGREKYQLKLDRDLCIDRGVCKKVCPMQLEGSEIAEKSDCIKCGRCVEACPKDALSF